MLHVIHHRLCTASNPQPFHSPLQKDFQNRTFQNKSLSLHEILSQGFFWFSRNNEQLPCKLSEAVRIQRAASNIHFLLYFSHVKYNPHYHWNASDPLAAHKWIWCILKIIIVGKSLIGTVTKQKILGNIFTLSMLGSAHSTQSICACSTDFIT